MIKRMLATYGLIAFLFLVALGWLYTKEQQLSAADAAQQQMVDRSLETSKKWRLRYAVVARQTDSLRAVNAKLKQQAKRDLAEAATWKASFDSILATLPLGEVPEQCKPLVGACQQQVQALERVVASDTVQIKNLEVNRDSLLTLVQSSDSIIAQKDGTIVALNKKSQCHLILGLKCPSRGVIFGLGILLEWVVSR